MCVEQWLTALLSVEWEVHDSEMICEVLVVISELEFGLHNNTFNFMNHSSGNVQVI